MRYLRELGIFLVLLILCGVLLLSVYNEVESTTITQLNTEQMVHAQQAAKSIERFFSNYNSTLSFLAENDHIITMDPEGRVLMQEFFSLHSDDIASLTRVDENGIIVYTYPYESSNGANISSQSHVRKSMSGQRVVISEVFTAVQGFRTVAFAMPVFKDGRYAGSLTILIPFEQLVQKDLESVRILNTGYAWAISEEGTILYAPDSGMVDRSAFLVYNKSPTAISFITEALKGKPGISSYTVEAARSGNDGPEKYQAAFFPVMIGDTHWSIVVATPEREILSTLQGFRNNLILVSGILVISLFFFAYYSTRAWGIVKEEEQRRIVEAALRENEEKYRTILENIQDVFYRSDLDGNLIMASPSWATMLGYDSLDECLGHNIAEKFYKDPHLRKDFLNAISRNGSVSDYEVVLKKKDGTPRFVSTNSHLIYDESGAVGGVEGIFRDITERKRAVAALQASEEKFLKLFQASPDLVLLSSIPEAIILEVNDSALRITGYTPKEMLGRFISDLNLWVDDSAREEYKAHIRSEGRVLNFEARFRQKSGAIIIGLISGTIISLESGPCFFNVIHDITDLKWSREELVHRNEELSAAYEKLTAAKDKMRQNFEELKKSQLALELARKKLSLLNTITFQDIQNALFSLSGYFQIEKEISMDEKLSQYISLQIGIVRTIDESLKFAHNYQNLGLKPPAWQNVIHSFLFGISSLDLSKFSRKLDVEGLEIYADPLLEQVFFTLAENVVLHGKSAMEIALSYHETPEGIVFIFEDDGAGIPPGMKEKIFERRFEEKQGLGLFLVREILSITNITIQETGKPGKGARFEITVPKGAYRIGKGTNPR